MAEGTTTGLTWERRLALWLPGSPLLGAFLVAAILIIAFLVFQSIFALATYRLAILLILFIAYVVISPRYAASSRTSHGRPIGGPGPSVSGRTDMEISALLSPLALIQRSRLAGAAGVLVFFTITGLGAYMEGAGVDDWLGRFHAGTVLIPLTMLMGWLAGRGIYFSLASTHESPLLDRSDVDLLSLDSLYSLGRTGLRGSLLVLFGISIGGLLFLDTAIGLWGTIPTFLTGLGLGLLVLLRPAREVRNLIRIVKRDELVRLGPLLKQARDGAITGEGSTQGQLTDLMSYQARIESTKEWPFDVPTLVRFGLYLLIPVVSMVGGALVERVVDFVLG
jgi:hypothetical protein